MDRVKEKMHIESTNNINYNYDYAVEMLDEELTDLTSANKKS